MRDLNNAILYDSPVSDTRRQITNRNAAKTAVDVKVNTHAGT